MYSNEQLNAIHFSKIGFAFEFFTKEDINAAKESIANALNKKIRAEEKIHSIFSPTASVFKIEHDNSGEPGMINFITGSLPFVEAKIVLSKMLKWIRENGSTNDRSSIQVDISFDNKKLGNIANMSKLDIGKFVLNFDEDKIYESFPDREDSVYAKSIKFILPLGGMTQESPGKNVWKNYMFVNENYYGVDFTKIPEGYIKFRYIGGSGYEKKYSTVLETIEYFITSLYETLDNPVYSKEDLTKLDEVLLKHKDIVQAYKTYEIFTKKFPDISIMIDLKTAKPLVEMYYPKIRSRIFELLTKADMKSGLINYDSDSGRIQIKDADLKRCFEISGFDIFQCTIKGNIKNCDIFDSEINDATIIESNLFGGTTCKDCKIENSYVSRNVNVDNSFIFGMNGVFSGDMEGGVFRQGRATKFANISNSTKVIEIEKIKL
jgi:hypothetical protein